MSNYTIEKQGRKWVILDGETVIETTASKKAAEQAVESWTSATYQVVKADGKGWNLTLGGTVLRTFDRKAEAAAEMRACNADLATMRAEQDEIMTQAAAEEEVAEAEVDPYTDDDGRPCGPEGDGNLPPVSPVDMSAEDRKVAAKAENAAVKAARAAGEDRPATPVLDWMANPKAATKVTTKGKGGARNVRTVEQDATFDSVVRERRNATPPVSWQKICDELNGTDVPTNSGKVGGWNTDLMLATALTRGLRRIGDGRGSLSGEAAVVTSS